MAQYFIGGGFLSLCSCTVVQPVLTVLGLEGFFSVGPSSSQLWLWLGVLGAATLALSGLYAHMYCKHTHTYSGSGPGGFGCDWTRPVERSLRSMQGPSVAAPRWWKAAGWVCLWVCERDILWSEEEPEVEEGRVGLSHRQISELMLNLSQFWIVSFILLPSPLFSFAESSSWKSSGFWMNKWRLKEPQSGLSPAVSDMVDDVQSQPHTLFARSNSTAL